MDGPGDGCLGERTHVFYLRFTRLAAMRSSMLVARCLQLSPAYFLLNWTQYVGIPPLMKMTPKPDPREAMK